MKLLRNLAGAALIGALAASPALADFPERNIENIYPWNPGATMAAVGQQSMQASQSPQCASTAGSTGSGRSV